MAKYQIILAFFCCFLTFIVADAEQLHHKQKKYDELLSIRLMHLSFIAYASNPMECLEKELTRTHQWRIVMSIEKKCSFLNDCAFYSLVSDSLRLIYIIFRGTTKLKQMVREAKNNGLKNFFNVGKVNRYFFYAHNEIWENVSSILIDEKYKDYEVIFTGNTLGGALASISALRTVLEEKRNGDQVKLYTFSQPRVGNIEMARKHDELVPHSFRVVESFDYVPYFPECGKINSEDHGVNNLMCDPRNFNQHYHHGTEIWYSKVMKYGEEYYECTGTPANEDFECSNDIPYHYSKLKFYLAEHKKYFELNIAAFNYKKCYALDPQLDDIESALLGDETMSFNIVENSPFDNVIETPIVRKLRIPLKDALATTPLNTTETTPLDTTETTPLDTTITTLFDTAKMSLLDAESVPQNSAVRSSGWIAQIVRVLVRIFSGNGLHHLIHTNLCFGY